MATETTADQPLDVQFPRPTRRKLPSTRPSVTVKLHHGSMKGYLMVGFYPDTSQAGEIFINFAKQGTIYAAVLDQVAMMASYLLQHGLPVRWVTKQLRDHRFEPMSKIEVGPKDGHRESGSLFDLVAQGILEACDQYGANPDQDHLKRDPLTT